MLLQTAIIQTFIIHKAIFATEYSPILAPFIDKLNTFRIEGGVKKQIGKLLINSFYGKLATSKDLVITNLAPIDSQLSKSYATLQDVHLIQTRVTRSTPSNILVGAAVTAKARVRLYRGFLDVIANGGRLLYCDTDSIFAAFPQYIDLKQINFKVIAPDFANEWTTPAQAVFIIPKTYAITTLNGTSIIKFKGVGAHDLTFAEMQQLLHYETYQIQTFLNKKNLLPYLKPVVHNYNLIYNKRT